MKTTEQIAADCGLDAADADLLARLKESGPGFSSMSIQNRITEITCALYRRIEALEEKEHLYPDHRTAMLRIQELEEEKKEWLTLYEYEERLKLADERAAAYEHQKNGLEADLADARRERDEWRTGYHGLREQLQNEAEASRDKIADLERQLVTQRAERKNLDSHVQELEKEIRRLTQSLEELRHVHAVATGDAAMVQLVEDRDTWFSRWSGLKTKVAELENDKATLINRLNEGDGWIGEAATELDGAADKVADEYPATAERMTGLAMQLRSVMQRWRAGEPTTTEAVEKLTT